MRTDPSDRSSVRTVTQRDRERCEEALSLGTWDFKFLSRHCGVTVALNVCDNGVINTVFKRYFEGGREMYINLTFFSLKFWEFKNLQLFEKLLMRRIWYRMKHRELKVNLCYIVRDLKNKTHLPPLAKKNEAWLERWPGDQALAALTERSVPAPTW